MAAGMGTETKAPRGVGVCLVIGALALVVGTGLAAGPFAALAAIGACMYLLALAAGLKTRSP